MSRYIAAACVCVGKQRHKRLDTGVCGISPSAFPEKRGTYQDSRAMTLLPRMWSTFRIRELEPAEGIERLFCQVTFSTALPLSYTGFVDCISRFHRARAPTANLITWGGRTPIRPRWSLAAIHTLPLPLSGT